MRIFVETMYGDVFEGSVSDDVDLDGEFIIKCDDDGKHYRVCGWTCTIEILKDK